MEMSQQCPLYNDHILIKMFKKKKEKQEKQKERPPSRSTL
jgi:hypothetical protein